MDTKNKMGRPRQGARVSSALRFHKIRIVVIIIEFDCVRNFGIAPDVALQSRVRGKGTRGPAVIALPGI